MSATNANRQQSGNKLNHCIMLHCQKTQPAQHDINN